MWLPRKHDPRRFNYGSTPSEARGRPRSRSRTVIPYELLTIASGVLYRSFPTMRALYQGRMPWFRILASPARGGTPVNNTTILVVDDEPQIRRVLRATLSSYGYDAVEAKDGQEAVEMVIRERPALILMDVNMPGMNGLEACRKIRLSFGGPIIMVTVRNSERDKVLALDSGADDYVVKPFTIGELLARIRAALRRCNSEESLPKFESPQLSVDLERRIVDVRGERVHLSPKEFDVLRLLITQQGKPLTHQKLLQTVWGPAHV